MAHELDITNGIASFAARGDAWHKLGTNVDSAMDAETALREAHLAGWNVRKMPLQIPQEPGVTEDGVTTPSPIEVPGKYATVRTNPHTGGIDPLGVVGEQYTPVQNEDHVELLDTLVDMSGAHFETAGALRDGREVFVTMKMPESLELDGPGGKDVTDLYIAGFNSHDGSGAFQLLVTPVRVVCANTQRAALDRARASFSIRHTSGARSAIAEAREALGLTFRYVAEFEEQVKRMVDAEIEREQAGVLLAQVFGVADADTERQHDNRERHVLGAMSMLDSDANAAIAGTSYGVYNAVTEYIDHAWPTRAGKAQGVSAENQIRGDYANLKSRAFGLLTV